MNPHATAAAFARHAMDMLPVASLVSGWPPVRAEAAPVPDRLAGAVPLAAGPRRAPTARPSHSPDHLVALAG